MESKRVKGSRRALSQVVSSLILLVGSALLASGTFAYYAQTMTSASMKQEQLLSTDAHVWVNASGSQAVLHIMNIGDRDALIEHIEVKYSRVPWTSVYYASAAEGELTPAQSLNIAGPFSHAIGGATLEFQRASGPLAIATGGEMVLYIAEPCEIRVSDVGTAILLIIHTTANQYPVLVNAETA